MPHFKVETTAMTRRVFVVDAASKREAERMVTDEDVDSFLMDEYDISEDIDDISEVKSMVKTKSQG